MQITDRTKIDARIAGAFRVASEATGTSFERLAATAARESDLRTDLTASTSSAKGLFQFVDQTWLELIKKEGPSVGLDRLADRIGSDGKGGWTVADPAEKAKILSLKSDPLVSSIMAGRLTAANARILGENLGRAPTDGEVYAAHVLGASGATKLIRMAAAEPNSTAALAFPKAAAANPSLFYGKSGKPVGAAELLADLTGKSAAAESRVATAHAVLPAETAPKIDPKALADLVRAQATAAVAGETLAAGGADQRSTDRFTRLALTEKGLPGSARDVATATGPRIDGWRAKASHDAFSTMMRSDADASAAETTATTTATTATATAQAGPTAAPRRAIGGARGGIPFVDPNQPLRLMPETSAPASPAALAATSLQPAGSRPSRLMAAIANGAPAMPLPMVDGGTVVQPNRLTADALAAQPTASSADSGLVASGAARVRTVSIAPAPSAAADRPLLPPVPGERAVQGTPTVPTTAASRSAKPASRDLRPLDLLGFLRPSVGS